MADRIPTQAAVIEYVFGEKVPSCRNCHGVSLFENHHRAVFECRDCGHREPSEQVLWVPKDERVREAMGYGAGA